MVSMTVAIAITIPITVTIAIAISITIPVFGLSLKEIQYKADMGDFSFSVFVID